MSEIIGSDIAYDNALVGIHPRLDRVPSNQMPGNDRARLATHLLLTDVFTPLCLTFTQQVLEVDSEKINQVVTGFRHPAKLEKYSNLDKQDGTLPGNLEDYIQPRELPLLRDRLQFLRNNPDSKADYDAWENEIDEIAEFYMFWNSDDNIYRFWRTANIKTRTDLAFQQLPGAEEKYLSFLNGTVKPFFSGTPHQIEAKQIFRDLTYGASVNRLNLKDPVVNVPLKDQEEFYWAPTELDAAREDVANRFVMMPVGHYGKGLARHLVEATKVMLALTEQVDLGTLDQTFHDHSTLIKTRTARGRAYAEREHRGEVRQSYNSTELNVIFSLAGMIREGFKQDYDPYEVHHGLPTTTPVTTHNPMQIALQEGIITIAQTLSLLTAEAVPGIKGSNQAIETMVKNQLPNILSLHIPINYLGPAIFRGVYPSNLVSRIGDHYMLSSDFIRVGIKAQQEAVAKQEEYLAKFNTEDIGNITGFGCPVGRVMENSTRTGIEALTSAFHDIFLRMRRGK